MLQEENKSKSYRHQGMWTDSTAAGDGNKTMILPHILHGNQIDLIPPPMCGIISTNTK